MKSVYSLSDASVRQEYEKYLKALSSISYLFSDSSTPYLDYRIAENLFCRCFGAENLSRSCIAVDARIGTMGIGIKTFVDTPFQKIAEFDRKRSYAETGDVKEDAIRVSELRNERLDFSRDAYAIEDFIYHYIVRRERNLSIHECPMDYIDTERISIIRDNGRVAVCCSPALCVQKPFDGGRLPSAINGGHDVVVLAVGGKRAINK